MHYSDKLKLYFREANEFFPELKYSSAGGIYGAGIPTTANVTLCGQQDVLRNSEYYSAESNSFVHFTSLKNLFEIINSASFRIYSLNNSNDKLELKYALKKLNILNEYKDLIDFYLRGIFIGSFTGSQNESENFEMWRLYGQHGLGVAIEFEIENLNENWASTYFGKVNYGESPSLAQLKKFIEFHQNFQKEHQLFQHPEMFIPLLSMLHKNQMWSNENEYRLFSFYLTDEFSLEFKSITWDFEPYALKRFFSKSVNTFGEELNFISIPLNLDELKQSCIIKNIPDKKLVFGEKEPSIFNLYPHLKIKRIILGYQLNDTVALNISDQIQSISNNKLGYIPRIETSLYTRDFIA